MAVLSRDGLIHYFCMDHHHIGELHGMAIAWRLLSVAIIAATGSLVFIIVDFALLHENREIAGVILAA